VFSKSAVACHRARTDAANQHPRFGTVWICHVPPLYLDSALRSEEACTVRLPASTRQWPYQIQQVIFKDDAPGVCHEYGQNLYTTLTQAARPQLTGEGQGGAGTPIGEIDKSVDRQ
jgi:hypothetical protein